MSKNVTVNRIAEKLKELRKAHGYTQSEVAMAADIRQQTYSAYEAGKRTPSPVPLYKIASFYGIAVDDFLKLSLELDEDIYYDALPPSEKVFEMSDYLTFYNDEKYEELSTEQREMLYYFSKLDAAGRRDIIDYATHKLKRNSKKIY